MNQNNKTLKRITVITQLKMISLRHWLIKTWRNES